MKLYYGGILKVEIIVPDVIYLKLKIYVLILQSNRLIQKQNDD